MNNETMTPDHPRWGEFCDRLADACEMTDDEDARNIRWRCDRDHRRAEKLVAEMGCDVHLSLDYFNEHGGHCDCEVLLNVDIEPEGSVH